MSSLIRNATIQIRQDTAGNWTSNNPTPAAGELCLETDTKAVKIGDGSTVWTSLIYIIWPLSRIRATRATTQSIPDSTFTTLVFSTEVYDNLGEYNHTTGVFTAINAGYYQVNAFSLSAGAVWATNKVWYLSLYKDGALYSHGSRKSSDVTVTENFDSMFSDQIYLTAGQYIDIRVWHNQGAAVNTLGDAAWNYFSVHRLS